MKRIAVHLVLLFSVIAVMVACGRKLSDTEAAQVIRQSQFMTEPAKTLLVLYENKLFPASDLRAAHREMDFFVDNGLVEVVPASVVLGRGIGAKFALTAKGQRAAAAGWMRSSGPHGEEAWQVVTARKELVRIGLVKISGDLAEVDFEWKWLPTEMGATANLPTGIQNSKARLRGADGRWTFEAMISN